MSDDLKAVSCPVPNTGSTVIRLGHGSGGKMTTTLIEDIFLPQIGNAILNQGEDAAIVTAGSAKIAITTDSYVVSPLFFPGGNIGSLSVHGTINDLAMRGAVPLALSAAFILEEGFSIEQLTEILKSMRQACLESGIDLVAADTKVVGRGAADKLFITTSGFGLVSLSNPPSAHRAEPGDVIMINGDIGRHGIAIMAAREGLDLETTIVSDTAPLHNMVQAMLKIDPDIHCLRDLTRGGLSSSLNEIAQASNVGISIDEACIPVHPEVQAVCELLGFDPLYVACEGRFISIVKSQTAEKLLDHMKSSATESSPRIIGQVTSEHPKKVVMRSRVGGHRIVDKLSGEQLPRIC